jgi:tRNA pseudouridine synthase 10
LFLCKLCNKANGGFFKEGECHICDGACDSIDGLIAKAAAMLASERIKSFCISTNIPKDWLTREEDAWDVTLGGKSESVKSALNRRIADGLRKACGLRYDSGNGECRVVFDFSSKDPEISMERMPLFIFGRYKKHVAGLSQSRWMCAKCEGRGCDSCKGKGKNYESVEERIGEPTKEAADARNYVMHASGREDVDATNTAGRAFVLEISEPKKREIDLGKLKEAIAGSGEVSVEGLAFVHRSEVEFVTESHFDKVYEAEIEFGRDIGEADIANIKTLEGKTILQQTPTRVAHRRADLVRHRKIKHIEVLKSGNGNRTARVLIKAEAGTYIKELISGDGRRTRPSISEIVGDSAKCTKLAVTEIDDGFLDFCFQAQAP